MPNPIEARQKFEVGNARVAVYAMAATAGVTAAAAIIQGAIAREGRVRVIGATGNSQIPLVEALVKHEIDWKAVEPFHMDEYVGLTADHLSGFRHWIKKPLEDQVHPRVTHYIEGDAADLSAEIARYKRLLEVAPIDLAFVGFGEKVTREFSEEQGRHLAEFVQHRIQTPDWDPQSLAIPTRIVIRQSTRALGSA